MTVRTRLLTVRHVTTYRYATPVTLGEIALRLDGFSEQVLRYIAEYERETD